MLFLKQKPISSGALKAMRRMDLARSETLGT